MADITDFQAVNLIYAQYLKEPYPARSAFALALMPGDRELALKKMAKACGVKKAAMASPETAERLTGYNVGGISPFGLRQRLPAVMEESLLKHDAVMIKAGQRGLMLKMAPGAIVAAMGCPVAPLV